MLLRRSRAPRYSTVRALAPVDPQPATQDHPPDHETDRRMNVERFHCRLPFQQGVTSAKAGDDGRLQRSTEPSIVLIQGGHVGEAAVLKTGTVRSGHLATHDGKCDATRAWNASRDTHPPARSWLKRFNLGRGACLNGPRVVFHHALLRGQAHFTRSLLERVDDPDYHRPACDPPSTWSTSPVTWPACARYNTASMTSLTRAICPIGCNVLRNSFGSFLCIGVSTIPGATALSLIPSLAYSIAKLLITAFSPPLVIIGTAAFTPAIG